MHSIFNKKKIVFFDGDGTLYLGKKILPGAIDLLKRLKENKIRTVICTNNSSKTPSQYFNQLKTMGFSIDKNDILISIQPALHFLKEKKWMTLYVAANHDVERYIEDEGFTITTNNPNAVLLTYDTEIAYTKIITLTRLIQEGIPYFATHTDWVCPTENGPLPDIGTFIAMLEHATNQRPHRVFGKPKLDMIIPHLEQENIRLDEAVMIGDRLYTDIAMGVENTLTTILTLTGETTSIAYERQSIRASLVVECLEECL
jgi:HAD superfamily hydrolase (TIGR01450 family)